jgi:hypothetical protein
VLIDRRTASGTPDPPDGRKHAALRLAGLFEPLPGGATATHYEVLGVAPDASHDDIKRAYLDLALKHHPDRQVDGGLGSRERTEWRMQEVNAAWEVLRSPGRRASYDAELRGVRPVWQQGSTPRAPRTTPVRMAGDGPVRPPAGFEVPTSAAPFLRMGPVLLIIAVLGGIFVFTAYAAQRSSDSDQPAQRVEMRTLFAEGSCVVIGSAGGRATPVPVADCSTGGARRVVRVVDLGRPCPAGSEAFEVAADKQRLCLARP